MCYKAVMNEPDREHLDRSRPWRGPDLPLSESDPTVVEIISSMWKWATAGAVGGALAPFPVGGWPLIPAIIFGVLVGTIGGAAFGYILAYRKRQF